MRGARGIRLPGAVDTDYRPTGGESGVELVGMVGQKEDPIGSQSDCRGDLFVGRSFTLGPSGVEIEPAADQRRQLTAASLREPILLIANRTG
jgi:hypothetical protein